MVNVYIIKCLSIFTFSTNPFGNSNARALPVQRGQEINGALLLFRSHLRAPFVVGIHGKLHTNDFYAFCG